MEVAINIPVHINRLQGIPLEDLCLLVNPKSHSRFSKYCKKTQISYLRLALLLFFTFFFINSAVALTWFKMPQASLPTKISKKLPVAATQNISFYHPKKEVIPVKHDNDAIEIPALSLKVPLSSAPAQDAAAIDEALKKGVVFYKDNSYQNLPSNTVIAGHSTGEPWKGEYRFAFKDIKKLTTGDTITLNYGDKRLTYSVVGQEIIDPKKDKTISNDTGKSYITLVTCWPLWTTEKRLLVKAQLVNIEEHVLLAGKQKLTPLN